MINQLFCEGEGLQGRYSPLETASLNSAKFRQYVANIAWETEVWIADNHDHMVRFNGEKFMGPYKG